MKPSEMAMKRSQEWKAEADRLQREWLGKRDQRPATPDESLEFHGMHMRALGCAAELAKLACELRDLEG